MTLLRLLPVAVRSPSVDPMRVARFIFAFSFSVPESLSGHPESERSRSQGQGLLFWGDRQGQPVRQDGGGAETRRAAESGSRRPQLRRARLGRQAVKRSCARGRLRANGKRNRNVENVEPRWSFQCGPRPVAFGLPEGRDYKRRHHYAVGRP